MRKLLLILLFTIPIFGQRYIYVTIAASESLSTVVFPVITVAGEQITAKLLAIQMPDTGWTTADITFEVSDDTSGATWYDLYDWNSSQVSLTGAANVMFACDPRWLVGARYVRLKTSATQDYARTIRLIFWEPEGVK